MTAPALRFRARERRVLTREEAADYLGIGTTLFDEMVEDGRLPGPVMEPEPKRSSNGVRGKRSGFFGTRILWDRWAIDQKISDVQLNQREDADND
jgi:hypothetical protein